MMFEFDYLHEMLLLCVNPLTWLLAIILTRRNMNISTVLLSSSACQILSVTLPYLVSQDPALLFSIHSAVLLFLLSISTGASIGFFAYGMFAPGEHRKRLSS